MDLRKEYQDEEDDVDVYLATGHMIPWGIYGRWTVPEEPKETMGYWCIWHYEVQTVFDQSFWNLMLVALGCPQSPNCCASEVQGRRSICEEGAIQGQS